MIYKLLQVINKSAMTTKQIQDDDSNTGPLLAMMYLGKQPWKPTYPDGGVLQRRIQASPAQETGKTDKEHLLQLWGVISHNL